MSFSEQIVTLAMQALGLFLNFLLALFALLVALVQGLLSFLGL
jgi:hypothetical protein